MFNKFTIRELVFISLMSALIFVFNLIFGGAIVAATGIPLSSAFVSAILFGIAVIFVTKIVPKFGTWTILLLIYSILEMPTSLGGAPGFWPKIPINLITGILADIVLYLIRYRTVGSFFAFYVLATANIVTFAFFLWLLNFPGVDKLISLMPIMIPVYWAVGTVGIILGLFIWNRMKDKRIIKQIID